MLFTQETKQKKTSRRRGWKGMEVHSWGSCSSWPPDKDEDTALPPGVPPPVSPQLPDWPAPPQAVSSQSSEWYLIDLLVCNFPNDIILLFFHPFPLLISLLLNSHLSHFHFPVLWNGNNNFQLPSSAVRISCLLTPSPVIINKGDTAAWHECRSSPPAQPSPYWEQEAPWPGSPCLWHFPPAHIFHPCVLLHTQLKIKGPNEKCQPESWPGGTQIIRSTYYSPVPTNST